MKKEGRSNLISDVVRAGPLLNYFRSMRGNQILDKILKIHKINV